MIHVPDLTDDLLRELGAEMGGCSFTGEPQRAFLASATSCHVQAAPGHGKTTLLIAKLALLSRTWRSRQSGVCIVSHTNVARQEVERRLAGQAGGSIFLAYPHFIGTVTAFIDHFVALPYLRGLGWHVKRIDDDVFAAVALSRYMTKPKLASTARARKGHLKHSVEQWVANLELSPDFQFPNDGMTRLRVAPRPRQPGPDSDSGGELETLKAELVAEGLFRFADMTAIAEKALRECPALKARLRRRFPLVILDEAQDTSGASLKILDAIFDEGVAYQRLGDQNQTLYGDDFSDDEAFWQPHADAIPLDTTMRFGPRIAAFASRLTPRVEQIIDGKATEPERLTLFLFDQTTIGRVLPAYADEVVAHWGADLAGTKDLWAVASRHRPASPRGKWPKTLMDYHSAYRAGGHVTKATGLCGAFRKAAIAFQTGGATDEVASLATAGVTDYLRRRLGSAPAKPTARNVWRFIEDIEAGRAMRVRRLIRDGVWRGYATEGETAWLEFCGKLEEIMGYNGVFRPRQLAEFLRFDAEGSSASSVVVDQSPSCVSLNGMTVELGSVHSLKGKTVDAVLVMETEVVRNSKKVMDLSEILPHAFGLDVIDFNANKAKLSAATNIFVAATRPRSLLALAMHRDRADQRLREAAKDQGWRVIDLCRN